MRSLLYTPLLILQVELQITTASKLKSKTLKHFIRFVTNKQTNMQIVGRWVDIVEWANFASDLQMFILEEDVFAFEALLFEFVLGLALGYVFLK